MARRKVMLADVLWEAANKWLAPEVTGMAEIALEYSCNAVLAAEAKKGSDVRRAIRSFHYDGIGGKAMPFLASLGCYVSNAMPWRGYGILPAHLQGVRYMWLLLAMHVAADEGIVIEVDA